MAVRFDFFFPIVFTVILAVWQKETLFSEGSFQVAFSCHVKGITEPCASQAVGPYS